MIKINLFEAVDPISRIVGSRGQEVVRKLWCRLMVLGMLSLALACASQPVAPQPTSSQCDPALDEAVKSGDWEKALADHQRLLAQKPHDCLAMYHLGYIWGQLGDPIQEIHFYEQSAQCGNDHDDLLYFNMGMAKVDLGDLEGAMQAFEAAAAVNAANPENYFGIGLVHQLSGRPADAEQAWQHALELDPRHRESRLSLARLYLDQSRWGMARLQLDALQKMDPEDEEAQELRDLLKNRQALEY